MELAVIIATIAAFFSHYLIDKSLVANAVSVFVTLLLTWLLLSVSGQTFVGAPMDDVLLMVAAVLVISVLVGLVFAQHKKCSK